MSELELTTPHLVIRFRMIDGEEQFEWGVTEGIPMMGLLGALCTMQVALTNYVNYAHTTDGVTIIEWDYNKKKFLFGSDPSIPINSLLGMLEVIKGVVRDNMARSAEANKSMQRLIIGR